MLRLLSIFIILFQISPFGSLYAKNNANIVLTLGQEVHTGVDSTKKNTSKLNIGESQDSLKKGILIIYDSLSATLDSVRIDSTKMGSDSGSIKLADSELNSPIIYTAEDSIVYDVKNKLIYLYGNAGMTYESINLKSEKVVFDWNTYNLEAEGGKDSTGKKFGEPVFSESGQSYSSSKMRYNFKTKKGRVSEVITKEGEGFVHLEQARKNEFDEWYGSKAKYTTCENEEPHFYLSANRVKLVPNKLMVTGPANLVISEVPTPLYIPFGIFPLKQGKRSGIILPEYGDSRALGFFFRNGGYYWAVNDLYSLTIRGDIYTEGSWGLNINNQYKKRYKYSGNVMFSYFRRRPDDVDDPNQFASNEYRLRWSHNQDVKSRPGITFSSNVNYETRTFNRNSLVTDNRLLNTILNSDIRFGKTWTGKPYNFTLSGRHTQNLATGRITITLPVANFSVSRIKPFKAKTSTGKDKWYETIGLSYNTEAQSFVSTIDSLFLTKKTLDKIQYGMRHRLTVDAPLRAFKYLTIRPSVNYNERWYLKTIRKSWNPNTVIVDGDTLNGRVEVDTVFGFKAARDFTTSLSFSTKLFGIFNFKNKKIKGLRHVFTPNITAQYRPDFGDGSWGYYKSVQSDEQGKISKYSIFENVQSVYGSPPTGKLGAIQFGFNNNLEMKVFSKKDTIKNEKKIRLLDALSFSSRYNFAADSLEWSPISITARTQLAKNVSFRLTTSLDPYAVNDNNQRINTTQWQKNRKLLRLANTDMRVDATFSHSQFSGKKAAPELAKEKEALEEEFTFVGQNRELYYDFNNPWSVNTGYSIRLQNGTSINPDTVIVTQSLDLTADFNLTPKWKFALTSGYDFRRKEPTLTNLRVIRDLHCWELNINWTAFPIEFQTYAIEIRVKSAVLQDLKLSKKRQYVDQFSF